VLYSIVRRYDFFLQSPVLAGQMRYECEFDWGGTRIFVSTAIVEGLRCFFIEPRNNFFATPTVYGRYDDEVRFDFFCKAALEFLLKTGRQPDILHCHDWSTAHVAKAFWEDYQPYGLYKPKVGVWAGNGCVVLVLPPSEAACSIHAVRTAWHRQLPSCASSSQAYITSCEEAKKKNQAETCVQPPLSPYANLCVVFRSCFAPTPTGCVHHPQHELRPEEDRRGCRVLPEVHNCQPNLRV
jgi:hypothetical protein